MANAALAAALKTEKVFEKRVEPVDQDIQDWVNAAHKEWLKNKEDWREITFRSKTDLDNILTEARRFTNEIRKPRLTIQSSGDPVTHADGTVTFKYRVRDKTGAGRPKGSGNGNSTNS